MRELHVSSLRQTCFLFMNENTKRKALRFLAQYRYYVYSLGVFFVWMTFIDTARFYRQIQLYLELKTYEKQAVFYQEELEKLKQEEKQVMGNKRSLEHFARERYLLKKEGEKVFVLVDENGQIVESKEK